MKYFKNWKRLKERFFLIEPSELAVNQGKTNEAFSEKWSSFSSEKVEEQEKFFEYQKKWFLKLYGYRSEEELSEFLQSCELILDAGCGLGYKAAWFASLSPNSTVVAIDYSDSVGIAYESYKNIYPNIVFAKGDISRTLLPDSAFDCVVCDQVIMHTENPGITLKELARIASFKGIICCYWYREKALPRELLDEYFRTNVANYSGDEIWKLSREVLELGKMLSKLKIEANFPSLPSLGIEGGTMDIQRFIYWNFIKCYWNEELGYATSLATNFDWYSPVNAKRFAKKEVEQDLSDANLRTEFFHQEEACYSGRFVKSQNV